VADRNVAAIHAAMRHKKTLRTVVALFIPVFAVVLPSRGM
jgi:hypothetical protein